MSKLGRSDRRRCISTSRRGALAIVPLNSLLPADCDGVSISTAREFAAAAIAISLSLCTSRARLPALAPLLAAQSGPFTQSRRRPSSLPIRIGWWEMLLPLLRCLGYLHFSSRSLSVCLHDRDCIGPTRVRAVRVDQGWPKPLFRMRTFSQYAAPLESDSPDPKPRRKCTSPLDSNSTCSTLTLKRKIESPLPGIVAV